MIQRWHIHATSEYGMIESKNLLRLPTLDGEWVKYDDHVRALAEKDREVQQVPEHEFQRGYQEGEAAAGEELARWKARSWDENVRFIAEAKENLLKEYIHLTELYGEQKHEIRKLKKELAEKEHELQHIREHEFQNGYREGEAAAKDALAEKEREVAKWKAAHDEMVARNRLLRDRPDLPADRIRAHDEWVEKYQRVLAQAVGLAETVLQGHRHRLKTLRIIRANASITLADKFLNSPEAQAFLKEHP